MREDYPYLIGIALVVIVMFGPIIVTEDILYRTKYGDERRVYCNMWVFQNHAPFPKPHPENINPLSVDCDSVTHFMANKYVVREFFKKNWNTAWNKALNERV